MNSVVIATFIRQLPRWVFLATLFYAPWDYGGATARGEAGIVVLLAAVLVTWFLSIAVRRNKPAVPMPLVAIVAGLLLVGWWMAAGSRSVYDTGFDVFVPVQRLVNAGPGSSDQILSIAWMMKATVLLGTVCFVADLARRPKWLLRIWVAVGLTGGVIALLGLLQRGSGAVMPLWQYRPYEFSTFFATYYYHANAGAFLNLMLPLTAGLAIRAFEKRDAPVQRAAWFLATLVLLVAIVVNTSRAAQVVGILTIIGMAAGPARRSLRTAIGSSWPGLVATTGVALLILFAVAQAPSTTNQVKRWQRTLAELASESRWSAYATAAAVVPDAGLFGFGPGTFRVVFPNYQRADHSSEAGSLRYLHEDYLQTLLEWGWLGSGGWAAVVVGGVGAAGLALRREMRAERGRLQRVLPLTLIALAGVLLHALVDFPLQIASLQLYTATYIGICWSSFTGGRRRQPPVIESVES